MLGVNFDQLATTGSANGPNSHRLSRLLVHCSDDRRSLLNGHRMDWSPMMSLEQGMETSYSWVYEQVAAESKV